MHEPFATHVVCITCYHTRYTSLVTSCKPNPDPDPNPKPDSDHNPNRNWNQNRNPNHLTITVLIRVHLSQGICRLGGQQLITHLPRDGLR